MRRPLIAAAAVAVAAGCSSSPARSGPTVTAEPITTTALPPASAAGGWVTFGRDPGRSGVDPTSPPAAASIRPAWTSPVLDGAVYAQPLVTRRAVIVATENDTVYSLNPSSGAVQWKQHLATPVRASSLPCGNIDPSGITGTPVIDPVTQLVWAVTFEGGPDRHTLWALRIGDGSVAASRSADAANSDPSTEQQRGALTLTNGRVYVPYGGLYGDCGNYHGEVVGLSTATGVAASATRPVSYATPAARAGLWSPPGATVDGEGNLLIATGNGLPVNPPGDANSVIRLTTDLAVTARFTAPDFVSLSEADRDLGSTSPTLVGGDILQVGKEGVAYLLNPDLQLVGSAQVCAGGFGGTATSGNSVVLSCFDGLYALQVTGAGIAVRWKATSLRPGPPIVAGGLVWAVDRGGSLDGFAAKTGHPIYKHALDVAGSFPTLSAYNGVLFVSDGDRVAAFSGV